MIVRWPWLRRLLVSAALASAAIVPLLTTQLPRSADGRPHLFRLILLDHTLRIGDWWPRYSPELVYGYGYPLFNFYAPLTYYLGAALHALGLEYVSALHGVFALALILGAWGMWTLTEEWFGLSAGAVAAAAYVFAPYTLFNTFTRGTAPEALAVALLPWLWWSLHRALRAPASGTLLRLAGLYAALLYTHNLTALLGTALLGGGLLLETTLTRPHVSRVTHHFLLVATSLLIGLALSAHFWLPAFLETNAVQVTQLTAPATLDFRNYFLSLDQLFTLTFTFDPRLEPVSVPVAFGLISALLAFAVVPLWPRLDSAARWRAGALLALLCLFLVLTLPLSRPVWEAIGPLRLIQFPWRFLGPATVCAAWLAGATIHALNARYAHWGAIGLLALTAVPWSFVTHFAEPQLPPSPTMRDIFAYEVESGGFGLTSTGEFLPNAVQQLPRAEAGWAAGATQVTIERLEVASLPQMVTVAESVSERLAARARFNATKSFSATFRWLYFPGWQAEVDGQPVSIEPSRPNGFITVPVPAGEHTVRVYFGVTLLRQLAASLSVAGLIGLAMLLIITRRPLPAGEGPGAKVKSESLSHFPLHVSLITLGLALAVFRFAINEADTPFRRSRFDGQTVADAAQSLAVNFGEQLHLIGFDPPTATPADAPLTFTLYWTLFGTADADYSIAAQLWDADGHLIGQGDSQHPNGAPTTRWLLGNYAADGHALAPYPGTLPGEYRLMIGVYPAGGANVEVKTADGLALGRFFEIARVTVLPPTRSPNEAELNPAQFIRAPLGPVELIGVDGLRPAMAAGDEWPLVLYYRVGDEALRTARLQLELVGTAGTSTPLAAPPLLGEAGATVRAPYTLLIPPQTPAGRAEVRASVMGQSGERLGERVTLGTVAVAVPARVFEAPPFVSAINARFGTAIELLGLESSTETLQSGAPLPLTLYWRAREVTPTRYSVFIHLLNAQGEIVAQTDDSPTQGTRPTTGWLPPEVITDAHSLNLPAALPPGDYTLTVGLYDPRTGERLPVEGGADRVVLQRWTVTP
jgi:hypothetical protein